MVFHRIHFSTSLRSQSGLVPGGPSLTMKALTPDNWFFVESPQTTVYRSPLWGWLLTKDLEIACRGASSRRI